MSDTALQTEAGASEQAVVPSTAGEVASGQSGAVSFAEVVRVHYEWERAMRRGAPDDELEQRFRDKLREFQQKEGTLLHAYWSRRRPSAVALTVRHRRRQKRRKLALWRPLLGKASRTDDPLTDPDAIIRLHRVTDWLARESPIADLLHHCDTLGIRVGEILRGTSERIAMQWIFAVQSHLLGFIERTEGKATKVRGGHGAGRTRLRSVRGRRPRPGHRRAPGPRQRREGLGVMNIAGALPSSVAPAVAPAILAVGGGSYSVLYGVAGACAIVGAGAILRVKRVR